MILLNGQIVKPTVFPDRTTQVWKITENNPHLKYAPELKVTWEFEQEAELIHLAQLKMLLDNINPKAVKTLNIPFLPYARQDKQVSDSSTFALAPFARLLNTMEWDAVLVFDPHSNVEKLINRSFAIQPYKEIQQALGLIESDIIVFPDEGAWGRYRLLTMPHSACALSKTRNQLTGEITGMKMSSGFFTDVSNRRCLIVDDICDGGGTFVLAAKLLYKSGAKQVDLYVSHGIFSKGVDVLHNAGIKNIFTKEGLFVKG